MTRALAIAALALGLTGCPAEPDFSPRDAAPLADARVGASLDAGLDAARPADRGLADRGLADAALDADPTDATRTDARALDQAVPDQAVPDRGPAGPAIVGDWVSAGDDVAPLLAGAPGNIRRLDATFTAAGTFDVVAVNANGEQLPLRGTYTVDGDTSPGSIVLTQTSPYDATSEGLWQVVGDTLTYEVVETVPGLGATPPRDGFGSTSNGQFGEDNIQIYRRAQ